MIIMVQLCELYSLVNTLKIEAATIILKELKLPQVKREPIVQH